MSPLLLLLIVVMGAAAAAAGFWLIRSSGEAPDAERPPLVESTDAHGRSRIIERTVYLALELCRVDGAIDETEIAAIEKALTAGIVAVPEEEAARMVHRALRATIRQAQIGPALEEIARHADAAHRDWVVQKLQAVAGADGTVNDEEQRFLDKVYRDLGVARPK